MIMQQGMLRSLVFTHLAWVKNSFFQRHSTKKLSKCLNGFRSNSITSLTKRTKILTCGKIKRQDLSTEEHNCMLMLILTGMGNQMLHLWLQMEEGQLTICIHFHLRVAKWSLETLVAKMCSLVAIAEQSSFSRKMGCSSSIIHLVSLY